MIYWIDDSHLKIQEEKFYVHPTEQRKKQEARQSRWQPI